MTPPPAATPRYSAPTPRLHRLLLRLYPRSFRHEYGGEIGRVFVSRRRDAGGPLAIAALWVSEIADTVVSASRVHLDILRQDLRHGARALRRSPGFFVASVLVTALGIGATTAAFTLADHVLVRPLPFPEPDRLVKIWQGDASRPASLRSFAGTNDVAPANYRDWKTLSSSFTVMGGYGIVSSNLVGTGEPERLSGAAVTPDAMRAIGITPAIGRPLSDADDRPGAPCAVLVSDAFWRRALAGDSSALGRTIRLDAELCTIAGVMPPGFDFPFRGTTFWRPIRFANDAFEDRNDTYLRVIARLRPGVTRDQAAVEMAGVSATLAQTYPRDNREIGAVVLALRDEIADQSRVLLFALAGASACVLLIACTNLASLLLARATARAHELAVRTALGAGRERLVRQILTESLAVALVGGMLGVGLAIGAIPLAAQLVPTALPIAETPTIDARLLAIAAVSTIATALLWSLVPALRVSRRADTRALRDGARAGASRWTERTRGGLVVAQVVASVTLLVCAGLLLRALWRVQQVDPGFDSRGVVTMRLNLPWPGYASNATRVDFYRRAIDQLEAHPDIARAAFASYLPLTMRGGIWGVYLPGRSLDTGAEAQSASVRFVTPGYFDVMGIALRSGRAFDERDSLQGAQTAIVSETFGDALWPGVSPVGQRVILMRTERTIVGTVKEVRVRGLERRSEPQLYMPHAQQPDNSFISYTPRDLAVKVRPGAATGPLTGSIREIVRAIDPELPISDVRPLGAIVEADTAARAVQARALTVFALVAWLLAGVGLHGLLSFVVSARTREIGVRVALGATRGGIVRMVLARGVRLALIGAAVGIGAAWMAGRAVRSVLAGVDPADVLTVAAAVTLSVVMTLAGSLVPALRASRTDPIAATRAE